MVKKDSEIILIAKLMVGAQQFIKTIHTVVSSLFKFSLLKYSIIKVSQRV